MATSTHPVQQAFQSRRLWVCGVLLALSTVGYFVQCFTPLRLTPDVVTYLSMASSARTGLGFTQHGGPTGYPPGYPALIWILERMGLGNSLFLNFLNLLALAVALLALRSIAVARRVSEAAVPAVVACLFSYVVVKHAALPLTDITFLGVTTVSIAMAETAAAKGRRAGILWACAFVAAALGIAFRVAGLVTVPVLLFECWRIEFRPRSRFGWKSAAVFGIAIVAFSIAGFQWAVSRDMGLKGSAVQTHLKTLNQRPLVAVVGTHIAELGALALNVPPSTLPSSVKPFLYMAGLAFAGLVGLGLGNVARPWTPGNTFLLCYSLTVLLWPENIDPRFWLPVVPLLALEVVGAATRTAAASRPWSRFIGSRYATYFVVVGALTMAYSVQLTISRSAFLNAAANKHWRPSYEAWMHPDRVSNPSRTDPEVLSLLREFGGNR
jgi:hypothetical protein